MVYTALKSCLGEKKTLKNYRSGLAQTHGGYVIVALKMVLHPLRSMADVIIDAQLSLLSALDAISLVHIAILPLEVGLKVSSGTSRPV